ncbi:sensor histidine kinase [Jeotgalibacillus haloalkalitolerans]|uniref:histidine kinase n=1 Tax=Jeotgalibacillus haloalkalitolerans TaxID=3104292 RepID=A0ABU5KN31_9BACL|nr:HAMP domain-containing sensor histidine kinase [Jeotgalibacillus sp. HH7-29]MDZ5712670.1 HAMP domain-containing sensor histidine kinase [Jeotgalibacillus sp. HH7-29]
MNIHRRFATQLFFQLVLIFFLIGSLMILLGAIIGFTVSDNEIKKDLSTAESYFIAENISIEDKTVSIDHHLKEIVANQNGWLAVFSADGKLLGDYLAPEKVVSQINADGFSGQLLNNNTSDYTYWQLDETTDDSPVVIFGHEKIESVLLEEVKQQVNWENSQLSLQDETTDLLKENSGWVQLIDQSGKVIYQYDAGSQPDSYSIEQVLRLNQSDINAVQAVYDESTNQTLLVGTQLQQTGSASEEPLYSLIENSIVLISILLFLLLLGSTFWYTRKFSSPLLQMMKWIDQLGNGIYQQPINHLQEPVLYKKDGRLKKKYRLYKDLILNLSHLTQTLKENEEQREKMTSTREEWISGISHDLKTPLSSISGYANMLETEEYTWSAEETRAFAGTISSKAIYMKDLLEDLTLTYRIKNDALPIEMEQTDIDELIRRTIISFMNNPVYSDKKLSYHSLSNQMMAEIDPKWFQRIMNNLIENALRYNPAGTKITVTLATIEQHLLQIKIADDGIGMDQATVNHLFNRYFRGTNTSDSGSGTGLGMAITKQLVQLHKGSINVNSKPGKGTIFRILLPVK